MFASNLMCEGQKLEDSCTLAGREEAVTSRRCDGLLCPDRHGKLWRSVDPWSDSNAIIALVQREAYRDHARSAQNPQQHVKIRSRHKTLRPLCVARVARLTYRLSSTGTTLAFFAAADGGGQSLHKDHRCRLAIGCTPSSLELATANDMQSAGLLEV